MIEIEKGVPIPPRKSGPKTVVRRASMEIGDSYFVACVSKQEASKEAIAARTWGYGNGMKFSTRQVEGGVRIWRIA